MIALTCTNILAAVIGVALIVVALIACVKDPQTTCNNKCIGTFFFIIFLLISATLAFAMTIPPSYTMSEGFIMTASPVFNKHCNS